jgi:hypothetical protein
MGQLHQPQRLLRQRRKNLLRQISKKIPRVRDMKIGDARKKNGAKWVQCSYCFILYHVLCQPTDAEEEVCVCDKRCDTETESD